MGNSHDIDRELTALIYNQTKNENFFRNICMFMDTDEQDNIVFTFKNGLETEVS